MTAISRRTLAPAAGVLGFLALRAAIPGGRTPLSFGLLAVATLGSLVLVSSPRDSSRALVASGALAIAGTAAFFVDPTVWVTATTLVVAAAFACPLSGRACTLAASIVVVPALLALLSSATGGGVVGSVFHEAMSGADAVSPPWVRVFELVPALFAFAEAFGVLEPREREALGKRRRFVSLSAAAALVGIVGLRFQETWLAALSPSDVREWSEPALLSDVAALVRGVPLYRSFEHVGSYTYSPGTPLLHYALLAPIGRALSATAHHVLAVLLQCVTALSFAWAASRGVPEDRPGVRAPTFALSGLSAFGILSSTPAAAGMHPDHVVHLGVVLLSVLWLAPRPDDTASRFGALLGPPVLCAFKLTAIGTGFGIALVALAEKKRRLAAPLVAAALLVLLTIPVFDACFGPFHAYALGLMSRHPLYPGRILGAVLSGPGVVVLASLALGLGRPVGSVPRRLALFTVGVLGPTLLAYVKEGGAWNNLVAATLPATLGLLYVARTRRREDLRFASVASVAVLVVVAIHPFGHFTPQDLADARADHETAVFALRADAAAGRTPLSLGSTAAFLDAGFPGVPDDLGTSAVELFMAKDPAFERHLARLADGRYSTIVAQGRFFVPMTSVHEPFGPRYRAAVEARYCVVAPALASGTVAPLTFGDRLLVLRRRDLGCTQFW